METNGLTGGKMGKIYITRHGETQWNTVRRMQGQNNSPLTELGEKQALWLAKKLESNSIDVIYSSSLNRALKTAYIIKGNREIPINPTNDLREIYLGCWQGRLTEEVETEYPHQHHCFWKDPENYVPVDGETFTEVTDRVSSFFEEVLRNHPREDVLIVAHAVVLKALLNHINNKGSLKTFWDGPHLKPTCLTILNYEAGKITFELLADIGHYEEVNAVGGWFVDED